MPFEDVERDKWYFDSISFAYDRLLLGDGNHFNPMDTTTRAMLVTVLWRMEQSPSAVGSAFADVPDGEWYAKAVSGSDNGIVSGYEMDFGPNDATRNR